MKLAREAMRTRFEIVLADERDPVLLRAAGEEALEEIGRVEAALSAFRPDSMLTCLNEEAASAPVAVDPELFTFLERAGALSDAMSGAFDLTVGALLVELRRSGQLDGSALTEACERVGFRKHVRLDPRSRTVSFSRPGVRLDPGAIGKGYALERAVAVLKDSGIANALLHGGTSSVYGMGSSGKGEGWGIAVQDPSDDKGTLARVTLRDQSLSVSAIHGRTFGGGDGKSQRRGHVLDPRTGASVSDTLLSAVVTESPTDADAISTGLLVLGANSFSALERNFPSASFLCATALPGEGLRVDVSGAAFAPMAPR